VLSFTTSKARMHASLYEATSVNVEVHRAKVESEQDDAPLAATDHGAAPPGGESTDMDVTLVGRDGAAVGASRAVLARHSAVLEEVFFRGRPSAHYDAAGATLRLEFCGREVLEAAVHHYLRGEVPPSFPLTEPTELAARNLAQLHRLAHLFQFAALGELTYRSLRKLVNKRAVLACAIFDELSLRGEGEKGARPAAAADSIARYALDTLRVFPMDTLLAGGAQWMREAAVEAIIRDQDIEVDEFFMFKILHAWAGRHEERLPVARRLAGHIELRFIDSELLRTQVATSGYFLAEEIREAERLICNSPEDRDPSEMERVLVEGAGCELANGIYCRAEEELGLGEEEVLFVKETDSGMDEMGLFLYGKLWNIAPCTDYSNCCYSCAEPSRGAAAAPSALVPDGGWYAATGGKAPAPYCLYLPVTRAGRGSGVAAGTGIVAPNLEEMLDPTIAEKRRSQYFENRAGDMGEKRIMTLEQMMHLPVDRGEVM